MVLCWLMSKTVEESLDDEHEHRTHLDIDSLRRIGVVHYFVKTDNYKKDLEKYAEKYEFKSMDEIVISPKESDNFEAMSKCFFTEHLHKDREMRFILEGSCYFDVRNENDDWVRILCEAGDLIILPAGIYHRFSLTKNKFTRAIRIFSEEVCWTPYNRNSLTDELPERKYYVSSLSD